MGNFVSSKEKIDLPSIFKTSKKSNPNAQNFNVKLGNESLKRAKIII